MVENVQCPVCTLFLHAGMNLTDHLQTHPKEQVIKALVEMTISGVPVGGGLAKSLLAASVGDDCDKKLSTDVSSGGGDGTNASSSASSLVSGEERKHTPAAATAEKENNELSCNSSNSNSASSSVTLVGSYGSSVDLSFANTFSSSSSSMSSLSSSSNVGAISGPSPQKPSAATAASSPTPSQNAGDKTGGHQKQAFALGQHQEQQQQQTYHHQTNVSNRNFDLISSKPQQQQQQATAPTAQQQTNATNASQLPAHHHHHHHQQQQQQQHHQQVASAYGLPSTSHSQMMPRQQQQQQSFHHRTALLPPPARPPPPAASASNSSHPSSSSSTSSTQQQMPQQQQQSHVQKQPTHLLLHQLQQQQQQQPQNLKIMYSSGLPPPPPLQLFTYQAPPQPQHQKPPPAYGAAISQIRSQHNQNKQLPPSSAHIAMATHLKHNAQPLPLQQQQQHQQQMRLPSQQQQMTLATVPQLPTTSAAAAPPPPPAPAPPTTTTTTSTSKQLQCTTKPPPTEFQTAPPTTTSRTLTPTSTITFTAAATTSSTLARSVHEQDPAQPCSSKKSLPLTPRATQPASSNATPATATATATAAKTSNCPFAILLAAAPSPSPSVLRYAESPVAHYLERDNGDFIVQETPKHIVECVEKEDGEFSVIERIYQSPPSVLHIHDDDDDDDEDGDAFEDERSDKVKIKESSSAQASTRASNAGDSDLVVNDDEEEFMSIQGDSDSEDMDEEPAEDTTTAKKKSATLVTGQRCPQSGSGHSISEPSEASSVASGSDNSDVKPASLSSTTSSKKKSSKNTITVLSDVQLNLNEYLDLVGNIMASKRTFPATAPIPLVKVEKVEPADEENVEDKGSATLQQRNVEATKQHDDDTEMSADIDDDDEFIMEIVEETIVAAEVVCETTESLKNANTNETDELVENNRSNNKTSLQQQQQQQQQKQQNITNSKEEGIAHTNNMVKPPAQSIVGACSSQVTSVIRMASAASQPPQTRDKEFLSISAARADEPDTKKHLENDVFVAEDLSQRRTVHQHTGATTLPPPLLKKGPKKLIIKPKSTKTDANTSASALPPLTPMPNLSKTSTSSSSSLSPTRHYNDELPTTSAMAAAQQRLHKDSAAPMVFIKTEPPSMATYEVASAATERSGSILEKQLKLGSQQKQTTPTPQLKVEKNDDSPTAAGHTKQHMKTSTTSADDARVLLDFANSSKRSSAPPTTSTTKTGKELDGSVNFLSNSSIFSNAGAASSSKSASLSLPNSSCSSSSIGRTSPSSELRCEDEFIPNDPTDAVQEVAISSSFSTGTGSHERVARVEGEANAQHRQQQQQPHHGQHQQQQQQHHPQSQQSFPEYPFSFFYGGAGGIETKGNFSPLYYQQAHDATNAATHASSGSSIANSTDDSASGSHQHHQTSQALQTHSQQQQQHHQPQHHNQHQHQQQHPRGQDQDQQWYLNHATSAPNADFETALAVDYTTSADGSEVVSKYLDLDTCKRESVGIGLPVAGSSGITGAVGASASMSTTIPQPPPPSSSTSSSFTAATESGGCTTDALSIRTDEKMPAKGEISEQESNCDIENSWSQPMYGDISARFFKTSFPGIFQHENGWNQDEYFTVQDLSATTATPASGSGAKQTKSFDFRLPLEASTSTAAVSGGTSNHLGMLSQNGGGDLVMPSTSSTAKKKRKTAACKTIAGRQLPSTITSAQMLQQQQQQHQPHLQHLPLHQQFQPYSMLPHQHGYGDPSTSSAVLAGPSSTGAAGAGSSPPNQAKPLRKKIYQCAHCSLEFPKLKDRNSHMIEMHNYVRRNRRLICSQTEASSSAVTSSTAELGAVPSSSAAFRQKQTGTADQLNQVEDSKQGIVKVEVNPDISSNSEQIIAIPTMALNADAPITTKSEFLDDTDQTLALLTPTTTLTTPHEPIDTKPRIQLPSATPSSKLATLYRMLVSYNVSTMKQNLNITECEEKLIETSIFFCYVCRTNFNSVKMYDAHLTEHPAECFTCGKKFQRWKNFSLHLKRHLGWKEFGCSVCDKKFVVRSALVEHMRMHTGVTPLKCKFCGKHFKRYSNLTQHRKRHIKKEYIRKKEYVCHCGEVLPSKARFLWHKETHDAKPKCCPHCCDRFVHANSLRRHIRLAHSDKFDYTEPMECPMCKQIFAKSSIKAHMATHSMETQFDCAICNKSFSTKWNLKIHSWVHANRTSKPFKCEHCPKAFVREVDYKNHINAHKQIKPYTCEYCGCKFIRKYNYMRHRREHHGNKKFTCDLCKKSFHRHYYLIEHRRIHTGERPFQCTICGKSSTTKTNHNKHLKIHHSRDPFTVEA